MAAGGPACLSFKSLGASLALPKRASPSTRRSGRLRNDWWIFQLDGGGLPSLDFKMRFFQHLAFLPLLLGIFSGLTKAQVPANDSFANRETIVGGLPLIRIGSNANATAEINEPAHAATFGGNVASNSVWYEVQFPFDGFVTVRTASTSFDLALAVYTGIALGSLSEVVAADRFVVADEEVLVPVQNGVNYIIVVDGFSTSSATAASGSFDLVVERKSVEPNNDFANTTVLSPVLGAAGITGHTFDATAEEDEPNHGSSGAVIGNVVSNSVWYRWTAPSNTLVGANMRTSFDAVISVYTGTDLDSLTEITSSDFVTTEAPERAVFESVEGTQYYIAVDGWSDGVTPGDSGEFILEIYEVPGNDNFFERETIGPDLPLSVPGTTLNASSEFYRGEPNHANAVGGNLSSNSVWYAWIAPGSGEVTVELANVGFDAVLAVYTGVAFTSFPETASADGVPNIGDESLTFAATSGTEYFIVVDSWSGTGTAALGGSFDLQLSGVLVGEGSDPYSDWIVDFPSLTGVDAFPDANPSGDGVTNLLKLVLGLDPTRRLGDDPNKANFPKLTTFNGNLALEYTINPGNLGVGGTAIQHGGQVSPDLTTWSNAGPQNIGGNIWVIEIQVAGTDARYGRLIATRPPF